MSWIRLESYSYWSLFVGTFLGVAIWESFRQKRDLSTTVERRWGRHGILLLVCTVVSLGVFRASPVVVAVSCAGNRFGLLNRPWLPYAARFALAVLLLDLVKYAIHRTYHSVSFLWRIHQVHHSDPDFDVSTAVRVHPIEALLTQSAYLAAVAILAPPVIAALVAELASCVQGFFDHANASLPGWAEKPLRCLFVTPDMHRVHHSDEVWEQSRNLGDIFPWWDRLFRTYLAQPAAGQDGMIPGLKGFQNEGSLGIAFMLTQPFLPEPQRDAVADTPVVGTR